MRTILNAKQWARLKAHIVGLDDKQRKALAHRIETWPSSVGIELSQVASNTKKIYQALDPQILAQVAMWLKKDIQS